jgi:hypothetical protein
VSNFGSPVGGRVDLLVTYDWPYDEPFLSLLAESMSAASMDLAVVSPGHLARTLDEIKGGRLTSRAYLDRASDTSPEFAALNKWAEHNVPLHLNPGERRRRIWNKTNLHWELINAGIHTPYTIPIPSCRRRPDLDPPHDLTALGVPFSIRPDLGGGGWGTVSTAEGWDDVQGVRTRLPGEDLILQQFIEPTVLGDRRGWFRMLYACGRVLPCWWDDSTRLYVSAVTPEEREAAGLEPLWTIAETAARLSGLELFSTEAALVADGRFLAIDYLNDPVDLRFSPHAHEGMPPGVARALAGAITAFLASQP